MVAYKKAPATGETTLIKQSGAEKTGAKKKDCKATTVH